MTGNHANTILTKKNNTNLNAVLHAICPRCWYTHDDDDALIHALLRPGSNAAVFLFYLLLEQSRITSIWLFCMINIIHLPANQNKAFSVSIL